MGRRSTKKIIEEENIWSEENIYSLNINETYIDKAISTPEGTCSFIARLGVIKNSLQCDKCPEGAQMRLVKKSSGPDGYIWNCKKPCNSSLSIRSMTNFCKLKMKTILKILYKYIKHVSFLDIAYYLNIDQKTASTYSVVCRDLIFDFIANSNEKIGEFDSNGLPNVVESDKVFFSGINITAGNILQNNGMLGALKEIPTRFLFLFLKEVLALS